MDTESDEEEEAGGGLLIINDEVDSENTLDVGVWLVSECMWS